MKRSSEPDFVGVANERLVFSLTKNLASMEHFSKRGAVSFSPCLFSFSVSRGDPHLLFPPQLEKLAAAVEQQRGSALRERTSFLVLTKTLLLGLGELSETQHLLTAQRVYSLLEPPLLEVIRSEDQVGLSHHT